MYSKKAKITGYFLLKSISKRTCEQLKNDLEMRKKRFRNEKKIEN